MRYKTIRLTLQKVHDKFNEKIKVAKVWHNGRLILSEKDVDNIFKEIDDNILIFSKDIKRQMIMGEFGNDAIRSANREFKKSNNQDKRLQM